jgi:glucosyl-dolichyl phosphate glucuronosyltransferase
MELDIIICTYNNANLLRRSLAKLAEQQPSSTGTWSVLVVDNACTDHTAAVVDEYIHAQTIPGLRRIVEPQQGLTQARLCGLHGTHSDWIAFVDDDCLLAPDWVDQACQFAAAHPHCGAFGGKVILEWEIPPSPILVQHSRSFAACDRGPTAQQLSRQDFHIPGAGFIVQRAALQHSGWLEHRFLTGRKGKRLTAGEDSEIILRILNAGYELWYAPSCVLHHFIPISRISETYLAKMSYGLGLAAPYIANLRWQQAYWTWLLLSILRILKYTLDVLGSILLSPLDRNQRLTANIKWNWTRGQIDGLMMLTAPHLP